MYGRELASKARVNVALGHIYTHVASTAMNNKINTLAGIIAKKNKVLVLVLVHTESTKSVLRSTQNLHRRIRGPYRVYTE